MGFSDGELGRPPWTRVPQVVHPRPVQAGGGRQAIDEIQYATQVRLNSTTVDDNQGVTATVDDDDIVEDNPVSEDSTKDVEFVSNNDWWMLGESIDFMGDRWLQKDWSACGTWVQSLDSRLDWVVNAPDRFCFASQISNPHSQTGIPSLVGRSVVR